LLSLFKKNNKKNKVKYELKVTQSDHNLKLSGFFNRDQYYTTVLWLFLREQDDEYKLTEQAATQKFEFHIKHDELMSVLSNETEEKTFNFYFKIKRPVSVLSDKQMNSDKIVFTEEDGVEYGEYFIRCGRFENTYIDDLTFY